MSFTKMDKDVLNISKQPDRVEGKANQLKALFDQAGADIKEAHNDLINQLEKNTSAGNLGATKNGTSTTVQEYLDELNNDKQPKETGKGLSTEDYTTAEKEKLAGIEVGANKTEENFTTAMKERLESVENGANNYVLPQATDEVLGGIILGQTLATVNGKVEAISAPAPDEFARLEITEHKGDTKAHITEEDRNNWNNKANAAHNHSASEINAGTLSSDRLPTLPITKGGTGATTAAQALINLGLTATAAELNKMDGVTATTAELNYTDGVTSNIQTQLNSKAPVASPAFTGTPKAPTAASATNNTQIATTAFVQTVAKENATEKVILDQTFTNVSETNLTGLNLTQDKVYKLLFYGYDSGSENVNWGMHINNQRGVNNFGSSVPNSVEYVCLYAIGKTSACAQVIFHLNPYLNLHIQRFAYKNSSEETAYHTQTKSISSIQLFDAGTGGRVADKIRVKLLEVIS